MKNYRVWVYLAIALAVAYVMAFRPDYVGNVGFLILGAVIAIGSSLFIEESKREREISELARAIHHELANRVARCCFDFEAPWYRFYKGGYKADEMGAIRLLKFVPVPPVIYPAVGSQIARLHPDIAQSVITFYFFLAAWERDIHNIAAHWQREQKTVPASDVMFLAKRLHQTIAPGLTALERLDAMIENAVEAERNAIAELDRIVRHTTSDKTVRERLRLLLEKTKRPPSEPLSPDEIDTSEEHESATGRA